MFGGRRRRAMAFGHAMDLVDAYSRRPTDAGSLILWHQASVEPVLDAHMELVHPRNWCGPGCPVWHALHVLQGRPSGRYPDAAYPPGGTT